jgi:Trk K+ transport system NAD-binding subunit
VKHVISKVNDPIRASTYRKHGIMTISRTTIIATLLEALLMGDPEVGKVLLEKSKAREARMADAV